MNSKSPQAEAAPSLYEEAEWEVDHWNERLKRTLTSVLDGLARGGTRRSHVVLTTDIWPSGLKMVPLPEVSPKKAILANIEHIAATHVAGISFVVYRLKSRDEFGYGLYLNDQNLLVTADIETLLSFYRSYNQTVAQMKSATQGLQALDKSLKKYSEGPSTN